MEGLTLDAGALIAAERNDRALWAFLDEVVADGVVPIVPAGALAQAWRGAPSARVAQLLKECDVEPLDEELAKRAGELLAKTKTRDAVDASIVVSAARAKAKIVTSDPVDLQRLADRVTGVRIVDVRELTQRRK